VISVVSLPFKVIVQGQLGVIRALSKSIGKPIRTKPWPYRHAMRVGLLAH
jgi:hypothetical protein